MPPPGFYPASVGARLGLDDPIHQRVAAARPDLEAILHNPGPPRTGPSIAFRITPREASPPEDVLTTIDVPGERVVERVAVLPGPRRLAIGQRGRTILTYTPFPKTTGAGLPRPQPMSADVILGAIGTRGPGAPVASAPAPMHRTAAPPAVTFSTHG